MTVNFSEPAEAAFWVLVLFFCNPVLCPSAPCSVGETVQDEKGEESVETHINKVFSVHGRLTSLHRQEPDVGPKCVLQAPMCCTCESGRN